jgi:Sulfatase
MISLRLAWPILVSIGFVHAAKPNIIVILADDMGWADLGVQQMVSDLKTPHLDALAASGVRLTSGYITSPQCSPSRAGLITGCHQQRYGIDTIPDVPLPSEAVTLAERLRPVGYRNGFVGKWHLEPNVTCTDWFAKELPEFASLPPNKRRIPLPQILRYSLRRILLGRTETIPCEFRTGRSRTEACRRSDLHAG